MNLSGSLQSSENKYRVGQTVFVRILQIDEEKHRCIVSLRSLLYDGEVAELAQSEYVLRQYLDEKYQIIETMKRQGTGLLRFRAIRIKSGLISVLGPLSNFLKETKKWIGTKCRCLIEKRADQWFIGRLENGLPAILPYDAHYSTGDSVDGVIIDFHLPGQQFVVTMDLKKPIRFTVNSSIPLNQCRILCQLPAYALAITDDSHHLIHLPTFVDLNSFYSSGSAFSYQRQREVSLNSITPFHSERFNYLVVSPGNPKSTVRAYQINDSVAVTIVDVLPKQLNVKLNDGSRGRVHLTELMDDPIIEKFPPLNQQYCVNQTLNARVIGTRNIEKNSKHHRPVYELTLREKPIVELKIDDQIIGFVDKIDEKTKGYWFSLSARLHGYLPPELIAKKLVIGQCYPVTITNKNKNEKGEYFSLSMFNDQGGKSNIVYAKFKQIQSANEFHFTIRKDEDEYLGILLAPDVADVFEDFVIWNYLMNVKGPGLINGQVNMKRELWKFRNRTIRAFVKQENSEKKQMILSTRKSRYVLFVRMRKVKITFVFQIGSKSSRCNRR